MANKTAKQNTKLQGKDQANEYRASTFERLKEKLAELPKELKL